MDVGIDLDGGRCAHPRPCDGGVGCSLTLAVHLDVVVDFTLVDGRRSGDERRRLPYQHLHRPRRSCRPVDVERSARVLPLDLLGHLMAKIPISFHSFCLKWMDFYFFEEE